MSGSGSLVTTRSKYSLFIYLLYCLNLGITIYLYRLISIIFLQRTYTSDTCGVVITRRLTAGQTHDLSPNEKVELLFFRNTGEHIKDAGVLFGRFYMSIGK